MEKLSTDEIAVELLLSDVTNNDENLQEIDCQIIHQKHFLQCDRFKKVTSENVDIFLEEQANINTKKKTEGDLKLFMAFLQSQGEQRFPELIPPSDLNQHISHFILSVREKGGDEFEPSSLRGMISSIDRYLRTKSYGVSIITDIKFDKSRSVLKMKMMDLKKLGKGNKPRASDPISDQDLQKMYKANTLGADNPTALLHSMWLICTMHFGMRTGKETHKLQWGDISLQLDDSNQEYIVYNTERQTKTRTGVNERNIR
ncbi:hypothetical protein ACJMK2_024841 [Sinanodonta woodiana]|uniref:ZMYM2-like/QRICH1 C-terminal domain-containing protein n=1 Tax=Sinanodonta woodiana TaxID=1069815 RepID=A0ABD3XGI4_SINWO